MKPALRRMTKKEIIWLGEHYCQHHVTYLEHYNCFLKEKPDSPFKERIGYLDIETSGFFADYDFMLSWCILDEDTGKILGDLIKSEEIIKNYTFDKRICESLNKTLKKFDRIIVYNGSDYRFDIPFARTRAVKWGISFPQHRELYVEDVYSVIKQKFRFSRKKLGNVCGLFDIPAKTIGGNPNIWMRASAGKIEALNYVYRHNKEDVCSLQALYKKTQNYSLRGKRSI